MGKKRKMTNTKDLRKSSRHKIVQGSQSDQKQIFSDNFQCQEIIKKNILIKFQHFDEMVQNFDITSFINDKQQLSTKKLLNSLSQLCGFSTIILEMKFLLQDSQIWMSCPKNDINIQKDDYIKYDQIHIQLIKNTQLIETIMKDSGDQLDQHSSQEAQDSKKCRRLKQRKIRNVIQKVLKWRQLYAGGQNGNDTRIPLQEGAKMVKISKKTLDDYLSQIKKGKKYNFNFNQHKNDKIGVLRDFIRKCQRRLQK